MLKRVCTILVAALMLSPTALADGWRTQRIHEKFHAEDSSAGDIDGDGHVDIVAGPLWYRGPDFRESFEIAGVRDFPIAAYSDQFFSFVFDANADGAVDVLAIGFPGQAARLYLNPRGDFDKPWKMHEVADIVDNESPTVVQIVPGGLPELVCGREGQYGFYQAGDDPTAGWTWTAVTRPGACAGRFAHALGVGDVNGDGRLDILDRFLWWEQPESLDAQSVWKQHRWAPDDYGGGGAQIRVDDIDGDGDHDIVTSLNAHAYGLAWFEQDGDNFIRHDIMGRAPTDSDHGVAFSQMHAVELTDIDGDGLKDIVTGKRWMAHGGNDPGGKDDPVLYWFRCQRSPQGVRFVPHLIHRDSGVGVDVLVTDLNADGKPDIVSCSKRGLSVHIQH